MKILLKIIKIFPPEASHAISLHCLNLIYKLKVLNLFFPKYEKENFEFAGLSFFNKLLVIGCLGNLTAKVLPLFVTNLEIFDPFLKSRINVIGPGQNFLYNLIKLLLKIQSFLRF